MRDGWQVGLTIINKAIADSEVFVVEKGGGFGVASTDKNGSFSISEMFFLDSTTFYIQTLDGKGRDNVKLFIDDESYSALIYAPQSPI